jgi:prepilin-type processing-associated H-X9-DG protein
VYCSKCGVENSDDTTHCVKCGDILLETSPQQPTEVQVVPAVSVKPKTSRLAIASLVMGIIMMLCLPLLCLPSLVFGIIALIRSIQSQGQKGKGFAIAGLVAPVVLVLLLIALMPVLFRVEVVAGRVVCGTNLKGLSVAMMVYVNDNNGRLPTENWCDLLMEKAAVQPKYFVCPYSDDIEWESSYAMNKHIAGLKLSDVSPNVVLLFETDMGLESGPRGTSIRTRKHFEWDYDEVVYKDRFNQLGRREDIVFSHTSFFGQPGCNIVFVDGHTEFVTEDRIADLQWTIEE